MEIRMPQVGDRVALPKHAVIFVVKNVDPSRQTIDVQEGERKQIGVPWKIATIIDP
jgi:hypothetical protein